MGVDAAIFESNGQRSEHYVPGVYSRSNNITSPSGVASGNLCILGKSLGGEPGKLLSFSNIADAKDILKGGELLEAVGYAFKMSNTFTPQRIFAMRVNNGTQSELILNSGETPILKIKSADYGAHTNQLKLWLQQGTTNGHKVSIAYKDTLQEFDNIEKEAFSIVYTGTSEVASGLITSESLTLSGGEDEILTLSFVDYPTLDELIARINDSDVFVATLITNNGNFKCVDLDTATLTDLTNEVVVKSNLYELEQILKKSSLLSDVEFIGGATRVVPSTTDSYLYFKGGTVGSYNIMQWIETLSLLETEDVQIIATPSTDEDVQILIASHCTAMASVDAKKERTCWLGASIGESIENAITKAKNFNNKYVSYVIDSAIVKNPITNKTETISGGMFAVGLAGIESALAVNEPVTNKTLAVLGFAKKRTITEMSKLIQNGVVVCNPSIDNPSEYVCIRAVTTAQVEGDLISCERSMVREDLYMNRDLRKRFRTGIGKPNSVSTDSIVNTLKLAARDWATSGYIIPQGTKNVWNIHVRINGDKVYLSYSRYLTAPRNFVFVTATNVVYESEIQL